MLITKSNNCPHCGGGHANDCFAIYDNGWHCFSCGRSGFNNQDYSYKKKIEHNSLIFIPNNITTSLNKMSLPVQEWLIKHYMTQKLLTKYNINYVDYDKFILKSGREFEGDSLLTPIIEDEKIVFYQRRFFPNKQILTVGDSTKIFIAGEKHDATIVLVEDYFSCIRLGEHVNSMCLFGTNLKTENMMHLLKNYSNIIIWLDDDAPGIAAADKIYNKLNAAIKVLTGKYSYKQFNFNLLKVKENEPKRLTNTELSSILQAYTIKRREPSYE